MTLLATMVLLLRSRASLTWNGKESVYRPKDWAAQSLTARPAPKKAQFALHGPMMPARQILAHLIRYLLHL